MKEDKLYKTITLFFGSWESLVGHSVLFFLFLVLSEDLLFFTMFLSIEAIFIGILILMATNRQQAIMDKRSDEKRLRDRQLVREDVNITQTVMQEIKLLKKHQTESKKALDEIKEIMKTTP